MPVKILKYVKDKGAESLLLMILTTLMAYSSSKLSSIEAHIQQNMIAIAVIQQKQSMYDSEILSGQNYTKEEASKDFKLLQKELDFVSKNLILIDDRLKKIEKYKIK